ncbi:DHA2 family efflux MFS transporter permease subunit [bacterium]|nr:DHA2 family efflux MFS transporter permease subunit [bacterium]
MEEEITQNIDWKPKASLACITTAVMLATFVDVLNTSIANVALKTIAGSFSISDDESLWIVTMFLIACSVLLPATDWCCRVFGRKQFFLGCIATFGISAIICGFAPNFEVMLVGRIFQGLGGGCLLPLSQAILLESYPKEEQGKAMAIFSIGVTIAPIIGPILGGWLTTEYCWNYVFLISVPFCIAAFIMVSLFIENPPYLKIVGLHKMDYIGFILLVIWISSFQVMVDNGQKNGWFDSAYICKLGIIALIGFIAFVWWELKTKEPLLNLRILKNWNYAFGTILLTTLFAIAYGTIAILPQFLQIIMGYTSYLSGLAAGPMGIGSFMGVAVSSLLDKFVDKRHIIAIGLVMMAVGCYMFSSLNLNIAFNNVMIPNIILGAGMTIVIISATTVTYSTVAKNEMTNASSLQNLIKNVGCAVGTSSVGVFVSKYGQIHQTYLVDRLTMLNTAFADKAAALTAQFIQLGNDSVTAMQMAQGAIYRELIVQSNLCAFMSSYKIYVVTLVMVIPLTLLLRKVD